MFTAAAHSAATGPDSGDIIRGWQAGDLIDLSAIDADETAGANDPFNFSDTAPGGLGPLVGVLYVTTDGAETLVQADVDGDSVFDLQIRVVTPAVLTAADFVL